MHIFWNSSETQSILNKKYNLKTYLFYSPFVKYYNKIIKNDNDFKNRMYDYGLIIDDFNKPIKNAEKSIKFLKRQLDKNVILIGKNCGQYKHLGFETIELVDDISKYYRKIKYIIQDSYYESCSNIIVNSIFNGCKIIVSNLT